MSQYSVFTICFMEWEVRSWQWMWEEERTLWVRLAWIFSLLPTPNISLLHCNPLFLLIHPSPPLSPILSPNQCPIPSYSLFSSSSHIICNPCIHSYTPSYLFTLIIFFHTDLMLLLKIFCSQSILLFFCISFSLHSSLFHHYFLYNLIFSFSFFLFFLALQFFTIFFFISCKVIFQKSHHL